jgi:hypothetical protein
MEPHMADKPTPQEQPIDKKAGQSWNDNMKDATPSRAEYYNAMRTDAYTNHNLASTFVEFWVGLQVDQAADKWRIMHYRIFDMDQPDGKFQSNREISEDVSFPEAVFQISKFDTISKDSSLLRKKELPAESYPAENFPELKTHFFDIDHYKKVARVEGLALDSINRPYRLIEGKVFATATFQRSEFKNEPVSVSNNTLEAGVLSDMFNTTAAPSAKLDNYLKATKVLLAMDDVVTAVGAFYLNIQRGLKQDDNFEKLTSLSAAEKSDFYQKANKLQKSGETELVQAKEKLQIAKNLGVHTEPFNKFIAECEVYSYLLLAALRYQKIQGLGVALDSDTIDHISGIESATKEAEKIFLELGGSSTQVDKLKAWVTDPNKELIPPSIPSFINRYHDDRKKIVSKLDRNEEATRAAKLVPASVKPPLQQR